MSTEDITVAMPRAFVEDVLGVISRMETIRAARDESGVKADGTVSHPDFSGHAGIALANLEGYLGGRLEALFRERVRAHFRAVEEEAHS